MNAAQTPVRPNSTHALDAQLVAAAAPDLLRALQALLDRTGMEYWPVEQGMARAAIAKATGAPT